MKIDRLIGILTVLLQNDKITAPALAERFEVSRRTILRDIDSLCLAGIPIVSHQGCDGGISIMDGYKINKSVLTADELSNLISALKGIDSVSKASNFGSLMTKLSPDNNAIASLKSSVIIDLSSHYKDSLSEKITVIRQAIGEVKTISFDYYYSKGEIKRQVEPYFIEFRWNAWYLFGWCKLRKDFRRFKPNRLWDLKITGEKFSKRSVPAEKASAEDTFAETHNIKILFDKSVRFRLIETYGLYCFEETNDGLLFLLDYTNKDWAYSWIMSFGDKAKVLEPEQTQFEIAALAKKISNLYD